MLASCHLSARERAERAPPAPPLPPEESRPSGVLVFPTAATLGHPPSARAGLPLPLSSSPPREVGVTIPLLQMMRQRQRGEVICPRSKSGARSPTASSNSRGRGTPGSGREGCDRHLPCEWSRLTRAPGPGRGSAPSSWRGWAPGEGRRHRPCRGTAAAQGRRGGSGEGTPCAGLAWPSDGQEQESTCTFEGRAGRAHGGKQEGPKHTFLPLVSSS